MKQSFYALAGRLFATLCIACAPFLLSAQDTIRVNGDADKYYPVTFLDGAWDFDVATVLEIGRAHVHRNSTNLGSLIAKFNFHLTNWGHGSNFIDADIRQFNYGSVNQHFVAGYADASNNNPHRRLVIWLKGGGTTYTYASNYPVTPQVYDTSPFITDNGATYGHKTALDPYINANGPTIGGDVRVLGLKTVLNGNLAVGNAEISNDINLPNVNASERPVGISWYHGTNNPTEYGIHRTAGPWAHPAYQQLRIGWKTGIILDPGTEYEKSYVDIKGKGIRVTNGSIGIGTLETGDYKLAVEGTIGARKVKVTNVPGWADHVFTPAHQRLSLPELDAYIQAHRRLPGIPAEAVVKKEGIDLTEMNVKLLEKVEELTLYIIELKKELDALKKQVPGAK